MFGRFIVSFSGAWLFIAIFFTPCVAQERTARIVEVLSDDQFIVEIGGREYRALNPDKVRELAKQRIDLETCKANESRFNDLITIEKQNVTIANQRADLERGNFVRAMQMFESERALRVEGQKFIKHGKVGGVGGKFLDFVNSPWGEATFKLIIPTAQAVKVFTTN